MLRSASFSSIEISPAREAQVVLNLRGESSNVSPSVIETRLRAIFESTFDAHVLTSEQVLAFQNWQTSFVQRYPEAMNEQREPAAITLSLFIGKDLDPLFLSEDERVLSELGQLRESLVNLLRSLIPEESSSIENFISTNHKFAQDKTDTPEAKIKQQRENFLQQMQALYQSANEISNEIQADFIQSRDDLLAQYNLIQEAFQELNVRAEALVQKLEQTAAQSTLSSEESERLKEETESHKNNLNTLLDDIDGLLASL